MLKTFIDFIACCVTKPTPTAVRHLKFEYFQIFKRFSKYHITRFILDCHADRILQYLEEAEKAKLVTEYQVKVFIQLIICTLY